MNFAPNMISMGKIISIISFDAGRLIGQSDL